MTKRPLSITILAWVYIAVGAAGFAYHLTDLRASEAFRYDGIWIELVRLLAVLAGAFMLRGHNWARWLALAWMALHVIVSAFHSLPECAIHGLFCAIIAWLLFRPPAARYFRQATGTEVREGDWHHRP